MVIKQFAADAITRTLITAPIDCNNVWLRCDAAGMTLRTSAADATTEDTVGVGIPWAVDGPPTNLDMHSYHPSVRFSAGDPIVSAMLASGSGVIIAGFS